MRVSSQGALGASWLTPPLGTALHVLLARPSTAGTVHRREGPLPLLGSLILGPHAIVPMSPVVVEQRWKRSMATLILAAGCEWSCGTSIRPVSRSTRCSVARREPALCSAWPTGNSLRCVPALQRPACATQQPRFLFFASASFQERTISSPLFNTPGRMRHAWPLLPTARGYECRVRSKLSWSTVCYQQSSECSVGVVRALDAPSHAFSCHVTGLAERHGAGAGQPVRNRRGRRSHRAAAAVPGRAASSQVRACCVGRR